MNQLVKFDLVKNSLRRRANHKMHMTGLAIPARDARSLSQNPLRLRHSDFLRPSSFWFRHSNHSRDSRVKSISSILCWLFAAPTREQFRPFLPETRPGSQIDPALLAELCKRLLWNRMECC